MSHFRSSPGFRFALMKILTFHLRSLDIWNQRLQVILHRLMRGTGLSINLIGNRSSSKQRGTENLFAARTSVFHVLRLTSTSSTSTSDAATQVIDEQMPLGVGFIRRTDL